MSPAAEHMVSSQQAMDAGELAGLPLALNVKTVARLTSMSPDAIYEAIAEDRSPWPVLRVGRVIRIPRAAVLASLGLADSGQADAHGHCGGCQQESAEHGDRDHTPEREE